MFPSVSYLSLVSHVYATFLALMQILPILQTPTIYFHSSLTRLIVVFIKSLLSTVRLDVPSSHFLFRAILFLPFALNTQSIAIIPFKLSPLIYLFPPPFLLSSSVILPFLDNFCTSQIISSSCTNSFVSCSHAFVSSRPITRDCLHCSYFKSSVAPFAFRRIKYKYDFV